MKISDVTKPHLNIASIFPKKVFKVLPALILLQETFIMNSDDLHYHLQETLWWPTFTKIYVLIEKFYFWVDPIFHTWPEYFSWE